MNRALLSGNEAIARGAYEAGVQIATGYPGTPSSEILAAIAKKYKDEIYAEWSTNEKVAMDAAAGAAYSGRRALVTTKQVGMNVLSDSLMYRCCVFRASNHGHHETGRDERLARCPTIHRLHRC